MEEQKTKRHFIDASVSAKVLYALTPLLRQTVEFALSEYAFFNQMNTGYYGCYLYPAEKGVLAVVVQGALILAIRDEGGHASEPIKVTFPDEMLDAIQPRTVRLFNENGIAFDVEGEPKADRVQCLDGFGIIFLSNEESKKYDGCLGTWFNHDHGNVIDMTSYRAETVKPEFIETIANVVSGSINKRERVETIALNPELLTPIMEAAKRMSAAVDFTVGGKNQPVVIRSWDDSMFGLLMVLNREERGPSPLIDILSKNQPATTAASA